jgi:tetratricopeptide (TPR) repeat protein
MGLLLLCLLAVASPTPEARAAFDRGERAFEAGHWAEAEKAYAEAVRGAPSWAAAHNGLGSALFKQSRRDEAILHYKAAIAADGSFKFAHFNLGYAARKAGDFQTALTAYQRFTELDPSDPDGYYGLAESHRELGQAQAALTAYEQFVAKETRPAEQKWVARAKAQIAALRLDAGTPGGTGKALAASPSPSEAGAQDAGAGLGARSALAAHLATGDRLMGEKKYRDATFAYQAALGLEPANPEALFKLGNAYAVLGYFPSAVDRWRRVLEVSSDPTLRKSVQANITQAEAKISQVGGDSPASGSDGTAGRAEARRAYEEGVQKIHAKEYAAALVWLTRSVEQEPGLAMAFAARGSAYVGLKRYTEAADDYRRAIRLDVTLAGPLYGLAEVYRATGRAAEATALYKQYLGSQAPDVRSDLQRDAKQKLERLEKGSLPE